jgi:hypothetical protein
MSWVRQTRGLLYEAYYLFNCECQTASLVYSMALLKSNQTKETGALLKYSNIHDN